jgi:hypothetical protein
MSSQHLVLRLFSLPYLRTRIWVCALSLLMLVPVGDQILWRYVYGFVNDLSPTTWVLFFVWLGFPNAFQYWVQTEMPLKRRLILWVGMVVFYVLALGSGSFDPYAFGYQPWPLLLGLTAWVAWRGRSAPALTVLLGLDLGIFSLHGLASDNLWDYLFDPVLMIVLGMTLLRSVMSRRKIRLQSNT